MPPPGFPPPNFNLPPPGFPPNSGGGGMGPPHGMGMGMGQPQQQQHQQQQHQQGPANNSSQELWVETKTAEGKVWYWGWCDLVVEALPRFRTPQKAAGLNPSSSSKVHPPAFSPVSVSGWWTPSCSWGGGGGGYVLMELEKFHQCLGLLGPGSTTVAAGFLEESEWHCLMGKFSRLIRVCYVCPHPWWPSVWQDFCLADLRSCTDVDDIKCKIFVGVGWGVNQ